MSIELKATVLEYEIADTSGYRFKVTANIDSEFGWQGSVVLEARGLKSADAVIADLAETAKQFIRMATPDPVAETFHPDTPQAALTNRFLDVRFHR